MAQTDPGNRERLLVASSVAQQLKLAAEMLRRATAGLAALTHGVMPALESARKALHACETSYAQTEEIIRRIP